jgi:energy-coupling factor transporter ATP-binding protein EcfA2
MNVRGRGCWRERDGRLCYHDGQYTVGDSDSRRTYLKKIRVDIGIGDDPIPAHVAESIRETAFKISFETPADALRCLAWSVLAPFAGGLDWRPSLLITGPSGSGKSTVANQIIRKLAHCLFLNGSESTVAGTRALVGKDSCGIVYDETEADTQKKKLNRDELFSLMRASVSDDAPDTVKGTKEGGYVSYKMQNMFAFIAIDPTVDNVADENRIFRINMVKPTNGDTWRALESELAGLLSDANCRAIRSLTWRSLPLILALARRIAGDLGFRNARGYRTNYADALLAAAYMVVWKGAADPSQEQLAEFYQKFYAHTPPEPVRDDAEELVNLILDQVVEVMHDNGREKLSVAEALNRIHFREYDTGDSARMLTPRDIKDLERAIGQMGIRVIDHDNVAIDNCHNRIRDIIQHGRGYAKIFRRHHGWIEAQRMVAFEGRGRRCTVIAGLIGQERDAKFDEQVGVLAL